MRSFCKATLVAALLVVLAAAVATSAQAQETEVYTFEEPAKDALFKELITELRCPKCQNQSIADSDAELARDLRDRTYLMVQRGASKQEVIDYMVARYGDFVHYQPPMTVATSILWWGPFAVLAIGALVVLVRVRSQRKTEVELSDEDRARLEHLRSAQQEDKDS
ncbi:cytochrome c-type biogenesis protein [Pseudidiomarina terrestris]|uniref:Cytochrome c-type biogenesis protein n=1 Tax=Pseudidiomarina terrestris TaxID=2820060 RepID=A0AAW7QXN9_9GAMM|nr:MULTISPECIES: cytochrome c-type biogenesis protein [unclassified Pseudidiomarina]MDN7124618.1 cytochrome c-type biogenesis protein CcmH [Pseudidiomarina sp. 1APP75-32.1]MDN7126836.1 cytochrome c-type biogenesis protein CcmH [Pseudidiomarina sp. 1APR75-33.1]MDN7129091.1 cytochrome c-type biogenesis protein CcmH [Pseudidiomarina sp. 1APR75-15]MDN7134645.1 cytochrome c-type biogenesis protein CcmH [Pseudidiomarina sp. 1ASP75-5]MEA3587567.1 cytochrome c-type biogenesis protein CcmH [Pseudidioma